MADENTWVEFELLQSHRGTPVAGVLLRSLKRLYGSFPLSAQEQPAAMCKLWILPLAAQVENSRSAILPSARLLWNEAAQILDEADGKQGREMLILVAQERKLLLQHLEKSLQTDGWKVGNWGSVNELPLWFPEDSWRRHAARQAVPLCVLLLDSKKATVAQQLREVGACIHELAGRSVDDWRNDQRTALRQLIKRDPATHGGPAEHVDAKKPPLPFLKHEKWGLLIIDDEVWKQWGKTSDPANGPIPLTKGQKAQVLREHFHLCDVSRFNCIDISVTGPAGSDSDALAPMLEGLKAWPMTRKGRVDVVLLDVQLGEASAYVHGHYFIDEIRRQFENDPLIAVASIREDTAVTQEAIKMGADMFLAKQWLPQNRKGDWRGGLNESLSDTDCWVGDLPEILHRVRQPIAWTKLFKEVSQRRLKVLGKKRKPGIQGKKGTREEVWSTPQGLWDMYVTRQESLAGDIGDRSDSHNEYLHLLLCLFPRASRILCKELPFRGATPTDKMQVAVYDGDDQSLIDISDYDTAIEDDRAAFRPEFVKWGVRWWMRHEASRLTQFVNDYCNEYAVPTTRLVEAGDFSAITMPFAGDELSRARREGMPDDKMREVIRDVFSRGLNGLHAQRQTQGRGSLANQLCLILGTWADFALVQPTKEMRKLGTLQDLSQLELGDERRLDVCRIEYVQPGELNDRSGWWIDFSHWPEGTDDAADPIQPDKKVRVFVEREGEDERSEDEPRSERLSFPSDVMLRPGRVCKLAGKLVRSHEKQSGALLSFEERWDQIVDDVITDDLSDPEQIRSLGKALWNEVGASLSFERGDLAKLLDDPNGKKVNLRHSYIHGDLNPGNILVAQENQNEERPFSRITDWGCSGPGITAYDYIELEVALSAAEIPETTSREILAALKSQSAPGVARSFVQELRTTVSAGVKRYVSKGDVVSSSPNEVSPTRDWRVIEVGLDLLEPSLLESHINSVDFEACKFANAHWSYWNLGKESWDDKGVSEELRAIRVLVRFLYFLVVIIEYGKDLFGLAEIETNSDTDDSGAPGTGGEGRDEDQARRRKGLRVAKAEPHRISRETVAENLGVSTSAVSKMVDSGRLIGYKDPATGQLTFEPSDVARFIKDNPKYTARHRPVRLKTDLDPSEKGQLKSDWDDE